MRVTECISMIPLLDLVIFSKFLLLSGKPGAFTSMYVLLFLINLWAVIKYISKYLVMTDGRCQPSECKMSSCNCQHEQVPYTPPEWAKGLKLIPKTRVKVIIGNIRQ